jgi:GNAT superfamily N-acetyltransferase
MLLIRVVLRDEIETNWEIDHSETIESVYELRDGRLALRAEHSDVVGWEYGEAESYGPKPYDCFDGGGTIYGAFEGSRMVGVAAPESRCIWKAADRLQLVCLRVSREHRGTGLGRALFERTVSRGERWVPDACVSRPVRRRMR